MRSIHLKIDRKVISETRTDGHCLSRHYARPNVQAGQPDVHPPDTATMTQMQSKIDHLREALHKRHTQIEQLNHLLAMQTKQNHQLLAQLLSLVFGTDATPLID